jgi:hypothetical protein
MAMGKATAAVSHRLRSSRLHYASDGERLPEPPRVPPGADADGSHLSAVDDQDAVSGTRSRPSTDNQLKFVFAVKRTLDEHGERIYGQLPIDHPDRLSLDLRMAAVRTLAVLADQEWLDELDVEHAVRH